MIVPGSNLLGMALNVIARHTVKHYRFLGSQPNAHYRNVDTFAPGVDVKGCNVQPVPRNKYEDLGLDQQKNYIAVFTSKDIADISRENAGDHIVWGATRYRVLSSSADWLMMDGWQSVLCVDIGPAVNYGTPLNE